MTAPITDGCCDCGAPITPETFEKRLLVLTEGTADAAFFKHLGDNRGIVDMQATRPAGGKDFTRRLRTMRSFAPESSTVLIVTDCNGDAASTFRHIQGQIRNVGDYAVPGEPLRTVRASGVPAIAVVTLPWIDRRGNLETLILEAMSDTYPEVRAEVDRLLEVTVGRRRDSISKDSKACFSCMVACTCDDDPSSAISAMWYNNKGYRDLLAHDAFNNLADFLKTL